MKRRFRLLACSLVLLFSASFAMADVVKLDFSHAKDACFGSDGKTVACDVVLSRGDDIRIRVIDTIPQLFSVKITKADRPERGLSSDQQQALKLDTSSEAAKGLDKNLQQIQSSLPSMNIGQLYLTYSRLIHTLRDNVQRLDFESLSSTLELLDTAQSAIAAAAKSTDPKTIYNHSDLKLRPRMTEDEFVKLWNEVDRIVRLRPAKSSSSSQVFTWTRQDFDIEIEIAPSSSLITNPTMKRMITVRERNAWDITTTTGFLISGLTDEEWTVQTQTTPATDPSGSPTVTRIAVREPENDAVSPEIGLLVHFAPVGTTWRDEEGSGWKKIFPGSISTGLGVDFETSGRIYLGASWPLGSVGAITLGAVGGKTKKLSNSIDPMDLGASTDPQASRVDVWDSSWFFGISWKLLSGAN